MVFANGSRRVKIALKHSENHVIILEEVVKLAEQKMIESFTGSFDGRGIRSRSPSSSGPTTAGSNTTTHILVVLHENAQEFRRRDGRCWYHRDVKR